MARTFPAWRLAWSALLAFSATKAEIPENIVQVVRQKYIYRCHLVLEDIVLGIFFFFYCFLNFYVAI